MELRNRRRLQGGLIALIFAAPVVTALVLTMLGWVPAAKSYGQPIQPERDLASMPVRLANGEPFSFRDGDAVWTLVALPGPDCAERCLRELDLARRAQITLGRHADKLRLLYLGDPPGGAAARGFDKVWTLATTTSPVLEDLRAVSGDSVSAVLVTPHGDALTRYGANFDAVGLGQDLRKAVH